MMKAVKKTKKNSVRGVKSVKSVKSVKVASCIRNKTKKISGKTEEEVKIKKETLRTLEDFGYSDIYLLS